MPGLSTASVRPVRPLQNVLLTEHGRAKVADVGLARMVPATQSHLSGGGALAD